MALWVWALSPPMQHSLLFLFHLCFTGLNPGRGKWSRPPGTTGSRPVYREQTGGTSWHISLLQSQTKAPFLTANRIDPCCTPQGMGGLALPFCLFWGQQQTSLLFQASAALQLHQTKAPQQGVPVGPFPASHQALLALSLFSPSWCVGWEMCFVSSPSSLGKRWDLHAHCCHSAMAVCGSCFLLFFPAQWQREHSTSFPTSSSHVTWD